MYAKRSKFFLSGNQSVVKGNNKITSSENMEPNHFESDDEDDAMEQMILEECRKIAWAEKGTPKVTPFRYKVNYIACCILHLVSYYYIYYACYYNIFSSM